MTGSQAGAGAGAFVPACARNTAADLARNAIHLWWLPYRRTSGRAPLKALLAAYLDTTADAVKLADDEHGRPHLAHSRALDFNWSHSGDHAMIALARGLPELGVDIEHCRSRPRALALAERYFAPAEHAYLRSLPPAQRDDAFMRLWTAKEAVLKAHGRGIAYGLDRVIFTLDHDTTRAQRFDGELGAAGQWRLHALHPVPAFVGMLAWRGPLRTVSRYATDVMPLS